VATFKALITEPPATLTIRQDGADSIIVVPLARCDDTQRLVTVQTKLLWAENGGAVFFECVFEIVVISLDDTRETFATQEREAAKPFIPDEIRPLVMDIVLRCYQRLLTHVKPGLIYRVTKESRPSEKALAKHVRLTNWLEYLGYRVLETGTDALGRTFWWMEKA
jgi:hypothetical protein